MNKVINDLYDYKNMRIVQYEEGFKFSLDSILLAEFVHFHKYDQNILDFCTGNAVIPLVLSTKSRIPIIGMEIQPEIITIAQESIDLNRKTQQINLIQDNINNYTNYFPGNNFDIITCNPPYFKYHSDSFLNHEKIKTIARHEVMVDLEEVIKIASYALKDKRNFYMVHIPERLQEIMYLFQQHNLFIKDLYFVYPKRNENAKLVLIRAMKRSNIGLKVHNPIYLSEVTTYQNIFEKGKDL